VYDFYIERPRLARLVLGATWGVDPRPFYRSLTAALSYPAAPPYSTFPVKAEWLTAACVPATTPTT
jgi:hypothetical protein